MTDRLDLLPRHRKQIEALLQEHVPDVEVWAYGSRVNGESHEASDLDLVLRGPNLQKIDTFQLVGLTEAFTESNIPFLVEARDWARLPESFHREIQRCHSLVQKAAKQPSSEGRRHQIEDSPDHVGWLYEPHFPEHWKRCDLYSLAEWVNGLAFKKIQFSEEGLPVIKIAEIKNGISNSTKYTQDTFDESVRVSDGDFLFSWSGQPETSIGAFRWNGPEGWLNQHIFRVTPSSDIDEQFFYYLLEYLKPHFVGIARNKQTTGLGHVTKKDLKTLIVGIPTIQEQVAIGHLLGALDDKIGLNKQIIQTLEEMADALFQSWFVNCDGVDSKMEGWKLCRLDDVAEIVNGRSYKSEDLQDSDNALVTLKSFKRGGGYGFDGLKPYIGPFKSSQVVSSGDIIVACTDITQAAEVVGRAAIVYDDNRYKQLIASLDMLIVRPKLGSATRRYLYHLLKSGSFTAYALAHTTGTTVLHLSKKAIPEFEFACPPLELVKHFDDVVATLYRRITVAQNESMILANFRDILLPKLIAGKLDVTV